MTQEQCPFCQLIANPDQLLVVGETDNFYAWLEINPRAKGHTMIVPKEHKENIMDFSPSEYQEAMGLAREIVEKSEKGLGADGASITVNIDETGGQMVPHAYIQVFPRYEDEENAGTPTGAIFPQQENLREQLDDIQGDMSAVNVSFGEPVEPHPDSQKFKEDSSREQEDDYSPEDEDDEEEDEDYPEREESPRPKSGHWDGKSYSWD